MLARHNIMEKDISVPLIAHAWVTGYDSQYHRLKVLLADGQVCPYSVQVLINGPADPFAVNQVELPRRGTKGIVMFPNRDIRSGVWVGAYNPNLSNAITSPAQTPFENFFSHWNGAFDFMDQTGNYTKWFTDGTYLQIAQSTTLPVLHRNVYNGTNAGTGAGTRQTYATSARIPTQPTPFNVYLSHPTGTAFLVDPAGNISVTGASTVTVSSSGAMVFKTSSTYGLSAAQSVSITAGTSFAASAATTVGISAGGNMTVNTAGNLAVSAAGTIGVTGTGAINVVGGSNVSVLATGSITASAAAGQTISVVANGTTFQIDATGNIVITLAGGKTMAVNSSADALVIASALVTLYNAHTHPVTATGGAQTGVPHVAATTGGLGSTLVKVAS